MSDEKNLDREGDIAADYLEELLDIADLDGDIEIGVEADRASVAIVSDDGGDRRLKRLIGRNGETLDALQELTRLVVQQETGERSRLMLDILDYRENHRAEIADIAREAIEKVRETGEPFAMKPMNPFERKVVHDVVAEEGLISDSSGMGSSRHVVIMLDEDDDDYDDEFEDADVNDMADGDLDNDMADRDEADDDNLDDFDEADDVDEVDDEDADDEDE